MITNPRLHPVEGWNESILGTGFLYLGEEVHSPVDIRLDQADRFDNRIDVIGKTKKKTHFVLPISYVKTAESSKLIRFVSDSEKTEIERIRQAFISEKLKGLTMSFNLEVTKDAVFEMVIDKTTGSNLKGSGSGNLLIELDTKDKFNMYGDYTITKGDFMFTLQNVINKRLEIQQGSTVSWTGHPLDADINLDAVYKVRKANVYDLTLDEADKEKRVEVNTHLLMSGKLVNPIIKFAVDVPSATNDEAIDQLNSLPEEDLNKQVLSLLLLNRFTALTTFQTLTPGNTTTTLGATTASELLSNQLSNWLSQISNDFDLEITHQDIAQDLNSSRVVITRILKKLGSTRRM